MITYVAGDLFESPAKVLVNTVNTVGVMGKGVALRFKQIYPEMFREYQQLCETGRLRIGMLHLYRTPRKWILNFPTKEHWRQPSQAGFIEEGLKTFVRIYASLGIHSIAFPPLGCGNGQLDFEKQVQPLMEEHLGRLPIDVFIYPPLGIALPEHRDPKGIEEWLRSEPESLPFDEVWRDLMRAIEEDGDFATATGTRFRVHAIESPPALIIEASRQYTIQHEDLLEFWQQLRQHGFTHRHIAADRLKPSYLLPVFERLPYLKRVDISDTAGGLGKQPTYALQLRLPARGGRTQADLFDRR